MTDTALTQKKSSRFFARGWLMVLGAFFVSIVTQGFGIYSFTMLKTSMAASIAGSTSAQIAFGWSAYVLALALVSLFVGDFIKKFGLRVSLILSAVVFAGGFVMLSFADNLVYFYVCYIVMGAGSAFGGVCVITGIPSNWFVRDRGLANGLCWSATFFGSLFVTNFVAFIIADSNWQVAVRWLAVIAFVVLFLASFVLKWRPQDVGLLPDGLTPEEAALQAEQADSAKVVGLTRKEALKTPALWVLFIGIFFIGVGEMGPFQNMVTFLTERGNTLAVAATFMSLIGTVGFFGKLLSGWVIDKIGARWAFLIIIALAVIGLVMLMFSSANSSMVYMYIAIALYGISENASIVCFSTATGKFLGVKHYAELFGVVFVAKAAGDFVGAPLLAALAGTTIGWTGAFGVAAAACVVSAIVFFFAKKAPQLEALEEQAAKELAESNESNEAK